MSEVIFIQGLTKKYGEKTVINHLNFSVKGVRYSDYSEQTVRGKAPR